MIFFPFSPQFFGNIIFFDDTTDGDDTSFFVSLSYIPEGVE